MRLSVQGREDCDHLWTGTASHRSVAVLALAWLLEFAAVAARFGGNDMLGRLILVLIQLALGWFLGPLIVAKIPSFGALNIFVYAVVFAIVIWLIGMLGAIALKDVAQPSPATLTVALVGALIGAGLTLVPDVMKAIASVVKGVPATAYPLIGAVLGYAVKR